LVDRQGLISGATERWILALGMRVNGKEDCVIIEHELECNGMLACSEHPRTSTLLGE
jgi:hypothetical protein